LTYLPFFYSGFLIPTRQFDHLLCLLRNNSVRSSFVLARSIFGSPRKLNISSALLVDPGRACLSIPSPSDSSSLYCSALIIPRQLNRLSN
jgi:hypothetical protein